MALWLFLLVCELLCPVGMILFGHGYMTHPAAKKSRGHWSGKKGERRKVSPVRCGKRWMQAGAWMQAVSAAAYFFLMGKSTSVVAVGGCVIIAVQLIVMVAVVVPAKRSLKETL